MGVGRTEIMRSIFGLSHPDHGVIKINGAEIKIHNPAQAVEKGIGFITEDCKLEGLVLDFSICENITLPNLKSFSPKGIIDEKNEAEFVNLLIQCLRIKTESVETSAKSLFGGNQQKVVIAKWIGIGPKVLILVEPTRGVDVGAKFEI